MRFIWKQNMKTNGKFPQYYKWLNDFLRFKTVLLRLTSITDCMNIWVPFEYHEKGCFLGMKIFTEHFLLGAPCMQTRTLTANKSIFFQYNLIQSIFSQGHFSNANLNSRFLRQDLLEFNTNWMGIYYLIVKTFFFKFFFNWHLI